MILLVFMLICYAGDWIRQLCDLVYQIRVDAEETHSFEGSDRPFHVAMIQTDANVPQQRHLSSR